MAFRRKRVRGGKGSEREVQIQTAVRPLHSSIEREKREKEPGKLHTHTLISITHVRPGQPPQKRERENKKVPPPPKGEGKKKKTECPSTKPPPRMHWRRREEEGEDEGEKDGGEKKLR